MGDLPYILEDVEKSQKESSVNVLIPSLKERQNLRPGQLVKLVFIMKHQKQNGPRAERMWVKIEQVSQGRYSGSLDNDPVYLSDLKAGDTIEFGLENIAAIYSI